MPQAPAQAIGLPAHGPSDEPPDAEPPPGACLGPGVITVDQRAA